MERLYEVVNQGQKQTSMFSCYQQLSEAEILDLQELFLSTGIHRIVSYDLYTGRTLVEFFLQAMAHHYNEKACLSLHALTLDTPILDVYSLVQLFVEDMQEDPAVFFEEFFTEQLYADFLWIEETAHLRAQQWYGAFLEALSLLRFDRQIPIVIISYESDQDPENLSLSKW